MPGINGKEFTERIRSWEKDTNRYPMPIVMCSGNTGDAHIEACLHAGVSEVVLKPISRLNLQNIFNRLILT